jgi:hypothetical protein
MMTSSTNKDEDVTEEIGKEMGNMNINNHNHTQQQQQQQQHRRPAPPTPIIICDAWYGFPHQKRPRKERVNAVCKQIFNFFSWRNEYKYKYKYKVANTNANANVKMPLQLSESECKVYVIGRGTDIQAIEKRMGELLRDAKANDGDGKSDDDGVGDDDGDGVGVDVEELKDALSKCSFLQDTSLEDLVRRLKCESESAECTSAEFETESAATTAATTTGRKDPNLNVAVYLSPDVETRLSTTKQPPRIVVVGMLVDRKVQANRSKQRVESLEAPASSPAPTPTPNLNQTEDSAVTLDPDGDNVEQATETAAATAATNSVLIEGARLPLEVLNVSDLGIDEPLNIDTVMEMMQRWWFNLDIHRCSIDIDIDTSISGSGSVNSESETKLTSICRDALARSMLTHRQRHPNRTIHGGASAK